MNYKDPPMTNVHTMVFVYWNRSVTARCMFV